MPLLEHSLSGASGALPFPLKAGYVVWGAQEEAAGAERCCAQEMAEA